MYATAQWIFSGQRLATRTGTHTLAGSSSSTAYSIVVDTYFSKRSPIVEPVAIDVDCRLTVSKEARRVRNVT